MPAKSGELTAWGMKLKILNHLNKLKEVWNYKLKVKELKGQKY